MSGQHSPGESFPDDGADAARRPWPVSASGATDAVPEDDDGHFEWLVRELTAGRLLPPESAVEGPVVSVGLGDAGELDLDLLEALCGPDAPGVQATSSPFPGSSASLGSSASPQSPGAAAPPRGAALAVFGEGGAADVLGPGLVLAALTARAVSAITPEPGAQRTAPSGAHPAAPPTSLTDDELIGVLQATRRLANLASWQQTVVIAEFARRRQAQFEAAKARGVPVGCRDGEFPGAELAMELVVTGPYTSGRIDTAIELTSRLPLTLAGMASGEIDLARACAIAARTISMTDADAAHADRVLAAVAPDLRPDQLARRAEALELKLAPEAVKARKELARHLDQRVEARREESGNACLAGRELATADVIASKAHIDALAANLRASGLFDAPIGRLRALVLIDLTQGRNPLDRLAAPPAPPSGSTAPGRAPQQGSTSKTGGTPETGSTPETPSAPETGNVPQIGSAPETLDAREDRAPEMRNPGEKDHTRDTASVPEAGEGPVSGPVADAADEPAGRPWPGSAVPDGPVPLPALVNLLVPAGTLLGWGTAPAQAAGWGLLDADEAQALVRAASQHPRTRWCMTIIAPDGTAIAHGCAAGQHPWPGNDSPPSATRPGAAQPSGTPRGAPPGPTAEPPWAARNTTDSPSETAGPRGSQAAGLLDLLRRLNITLEPIARDACDHAHAEDRYVPSRALRHLIQARNQTCTAPACNAQAAHCDLDHTVAYPDGPTDQCNLNPKCRRHHRTKQAPGWTATQPTPGTATWTTPSGRAHTTTATIYDL
jgi:hypothetical protein